MSFSFWTRGCLACRAFYLHLTTSLGRAILNKDQLLYLFWEITMRSLIMLLCFLCAGVTSAAEPQARSLFEPLPEHIRTAPMKTYTKWAKKQNVKAHRAADARAHYFNKRYPRPSITVITTKIHFASRYHLRNRTRKAFNRNRHDRGTIRQTYRTYRQPLWSGGPVTLINPYFRSAGN